MVGAKGRREAGNGECQGRARLKGTSFALADAGHQPEDTSRSEVDGRRGAPGTRGTRERNGAAINQPDTSNGKTCARGTRKWNNTS